MHNVRGAEWILALVTPRDRAASAAGDLAERGANRGSGWFWCAVWRIAFSQVWRSLAESPMRVTGWAFLGAIVDTMAGLLFAGLSGFLFFVAGLWGAHPAQWFSPLSRILFAMPALLISVMVGRMFTRRAPEVGVTACLVYILLAPTFGLIIDPPHGIGFFGAMWIFCGEAALRTPVVAGAVWGVTVRRRVGEV